MPESSPPTDRFPERLRQAREQRGLNQEELAKKSGLQPSAISHFETGARKPSFDNLKRLATALTVTTDFLLGRADAVKDLAEVDPLYRDIDRLTDADKEFARDMVRLLAEKAEKKREQ
jgi:transcriptional regulator with XRE-family HTH domain